MNSGGSLRAQAQQIFDRRPVEPNRTVAEEIDEMMKYYAFEDAVFLAELNYETTKKGDTEALLIYADCLYRSNKKAECFGLLRSVKLSGARLYYLLAKVAYELNKFDECRGALFEHDDGKVRQEILDEPRVAAHANLLHAKMMCNENHTDLTLESCKKSLDENVFLWSAVITYLRFGGQELNVCFEKHKEKSNGEGPPQMVLSPTVVMKSETPSPSSFGPSTSATTSSSRGSSSQRPSAPPRRSARTPVVTPAARGTRATPASTRSTPATPGGRANPIAPRKSTRISGMTTRRTETAGSSTASSRASLFNEPDRPHTRATHSSRNRANAALNSDTENSGRTRSGMSTRGTSSSAQHRTNPVRSSIRIADAAAASAAAASAASAAASASKPSHQRKRAEKQPLVSRNSNLARSLSGSTNSMASSTTSGGGDRQSEDDTVAVGNQNVAPTTPAAPTPAPEPMDLNDSPYEIEYRKFYDLYRHIACIEESISTYNWKSADRLFEKLDKEHILNTSMIRLQLGRACFEQSEYRECRNILDALHKRKPWKVEGTELLSTSMWHLQNTHQLSALAQTLTAESRERPQSWCAAGNCFSLQRQHTQAIECMERAIQLDKRFAYAYTLLGHELIVQDELDKAAGSFRSALLLSPRDYRAWYGLGLVHLKKEQNLIALTNIQKAVNINPTNRAMLCTLSQIEQQRGQIETALVLIDRALTLNPLDVACRFNRARLLFEAQRNEECLVELDKLKASSPDEAFIFHLLARVHRRMGNTHLALLSYSWAAELDPRGEQNIADSNHATHREEYEDDEYGAPV
uniref:Cell division cycle protein 27 homolog n=1 Tax=Caenorhabditis tropicalis TaxID=1561998 RepID=A0A1I7U4S5_9PELO